MIDKPTVFILGAGASVPYGYPTGEDLRRDICFNFPTRHMNLLKVTPITPGLPAVANDFFLDKQRKEIQKFTNAFFNSSTPSIDLFLARNLEFANIGKIAIVSSILAAEKSSRFREQILEAFRSQDWYSYLFQKMTDAMIDPDSYNNFSKNNVTFITFNYDRSLEHFLYESLRNSFSSAPEQKIYEQFSKIKIYHVYGVVDKLPWQEGWLTKYGDEPPLSTIDVMSENIKIIHERTISGNDLGPMKDAIKEASQVYFLGFGYARENIQILGIPSSFNVNHKIYGTAFNLIDKERDEIKASLSQYFHADLPPFKPEILNMDCRALLRNWL